jgi:hypothetical protein
MCLSEFRCVVDLFRFAFSRRSRPDRVTIGCGALLVSACLAVAQHWLPRRLFSRRTLGQVPRLISALAGKKLRVFASTQVKFDSTYVNGVCRNFFKAFLAPFLDSPPRVFITANIVCLANGWLRKGDLHGQEAQARPKEATR